MLQPVPARPLRGAAAAGGLARQGGADIRFVGGDVRRVHAAMRAAAGRKNIWIVGGGDLAGQFHDAGLLDEHMVQIGSVTFGRGKPLFPRQVLSPVLCLTSARQLEPGLAELRYKVRKPCSGGVARSVNRGP